jgi:hypothetical protein
MISLSVNNRNTNIQYCYYSEIALVKFKAEARLQWGPRLGTSTSVYIWSESIFSNKNRFFSLSVIQSWLNVKCRLQKCAEKLNKDWMWDIQAALQIRVWGYVCAPCFALWNLDSLAEAERLQWQNVLGGKICINLWHAHACGKIETFPHLTSKGSWAMECSMTETEYE